MERCNPDDSTTDESLHDIPGRKEWEKRYPTMKDKIFADINQCPPELVS